MAWCETSMPKRWLLGVVLLLMASCVVPGRSNHEQAGALGLGRPATADDIRAWNIDANPSGEGLPLGQGTAAGGAAVYASKCARCHGPTGVEGPMDRLVGGRDTLASTSPVKTVGSYWPYATTLYDYIYRAMPFDAPQSLTVDEVYAVTAWLLHENGITEADTVIDARTLPQIPMPNRHGFVPDPRPDVPGP
jgi:S-disulfanyl-L-cysteine oxidoreductase SoxD